jgi:photosystem II stability/assembly factor-like uncharacterized protein
MPHKAETVTVTAVGEDAQHRALRAVGTVTTIPYGEVRLSLALAQEAGPATWIAEDSDTSEELYGVWGSDRGEVVAVGAHGTIIHRGAGAWRRAESGVSETLLAVGGRRDDVWVGGAGGVLLHSVDGGQDWGTVTGNDGSWSFRAIAPRPGGGVVGVATRIQAGVLFDLDASVVLYLDGLDRAPPLFGVAGFEPATLIVGGVNGASAYSLDRGTTWQLPTPSTTANFYGLWGRSSRELYAVGAGGLIARSDDLGQTFSAQPTPTSVDLYGIAGDAALVYAIGLGGTIWVSADGGSWTAESSRTTRDLHGVWVSADGNVYAVGGGGLVRHRR